MTRALGLDFGLSGVRATVVDSSLGLIACARAGTPVVVAEGRAELDPEATWQAMLVAVREIASAAATVDVIGVGALGPTPMLTAKDGTPLTPGLCFALDRQADADRIELDPALSHDHALPKVIWLARTTPTAALALDLVSWIVWRLTGVAALDELTRIQYQHPGASCPLPLPPPIAPTAIAGTLKMSIGAPLGTPVIAGTLDSYIDVVAAGCNQIGEGCIILGSTLVVYGVATNAHTLGGLENQPYPGEGILLGGSTSNGGNVLRWARDLFGDETAASAEGTECIPYLAGERTPIRTRDAQGALTGIGFATTGPMIMRAVIDALAYAALDHADLIAAIMTVKRWTVTGGGILDRAWAQATADALGKELVVAPLATDAAGPAIFALRAIGCSIDAPTKGLIVPDPTETARFRLGLERYRLQTRGLEVRP